MRDSLERVHAALDALSLSAVDRARLAIIVEELLANLFEHGRLAPENMVVLRLSRLSGHLLLVLEDAGLAFDPSSADPEAPIPERGGGAGLALIRAWTDSLSYAAGPPLNRLELRYSLARPGD